MSFQTWQIESFLNPQTTFDDMDIKYHYETIYGLTSD
jgi:hypothetical protein